MKKVILVSVLAIASVSAFAAPAKSSKAKTMSDSQMAQVKGEGTIEVWSWTGTTYVLSQRADTGPNGPSQEIFIGGPQDTYGHH